MISSDLSDLTDLPDLISEDLWLWQIECEANDWLQDEFGDLLDGYEVINLDNPRFSQVQKTLRRFGAELRMLPAARQPLCAQCVCRHPYGEHLLGDEVET